MPAGGAVSSVLRLWAPQGRRHYSGRAGRPIPRLSDPAAPTARCRRRRPPALSSVASMLARRWSTTLGCALALCAVAAPTAAARAGLSTRFPAAGELVRSVAVRSAPAPSARVVRVLHRFRADAQFQIVLRSEEHTSELQSLRQL